MPGNLTVADQGLTVPAVTWRNPADVTYGAVLGNAQLNATASVAGTFSYSPSSGTVLGAGNSQTLSVTFTPENTQTHATVTKTVMVNVLRKALSIQAADASRLVGEGNPAFTANYDGLVNGDTSATSGLAVNFACAATSSSPSGAYDVVPAGAATTNYAVTYKKGVLTVNNKAGAEITWANPADIIYGTALSDIQLNAGNASTGIPGAFDYSPAAGTVLKGGVQTLTVTFTPEDTSLNAVVTKSVKLNVLRKAMRVTADSKDRNFGEPNPVFSASYRNEDFVNGDSGATLGTPAFTCLATAASPGGTYPIKVSGLSSADYAVQYEEGVLSVTDAGALSFKTSAYSVVKGSGDVVREIAVKRVRGKAGMVSAIVTVVPGTASDEEGANGDYSTPASPIVLIWGDDDDADKSFPLTLKSTAQLEPDKGDTVLFSLALGDGAATLGDISSATVFLVGSDSSKPVTTIVSPSSGAKLVATEVLLKGQATDNGGVSRVEVVLNYGETQEAALTQVAGSSTKWDWTLSVVPSQGANTVTVTAYDLQGNPSSSMTRAFSFSYLRPLLAATYDGLLVPTIEATDVPNQHGLLTVTVDKTGALSGKVLIAGTSIPFKGALQTELGSGVLFGAAPVPQDPSDEGKYNTYRARLLALGKLSLTRTVGRVVQNVGSLSLRLDDSGEYPVMVGELTGEDDLETDEDEGLIVRSSLIAKKAVYSAAKVLPEGSLRIPLGVFDPGSDKGAYTALFVSSEQSADLDRSLYPHGAGYARMSVTTAGVVTLTGKLADGTAVSYSNRLSPENDLPVFLQLYSTKGLISGVMVFDDTAFDSDARCEALAWFRPKTSTAASKPLTTIYGEGWPEGISLSVLASKYVAPARPTAKAPNPPNPNTVLGSGVAGVVAPTTNIEIQLGDGGMNEMVVNGGALSATSAVTVLADPQGGAGASGLKVNFQSTTGALSGSFIHPVSGRAVTFAGMAFQKTGEACGYFMYLPVAGSDPEGTPQSGSVTISAIAQ